MENQPSMDDQFLNKIYQHIEDNLDNEHYSVADLSRHAGLSRSMLHRKLIKLTGKSATFLITVNERIIKEHIPIWSGLYFTKSIPSEPLVFREMGNGYYADWKMGDKVWVSGIPLGAAVIHRSIMQVCWDEAEEYEINGMKMRRVFETPIRMWEDAKTKTWQTSIGTEDLPWCDRLKQNGIYRKAGWPEYQKKTYPILCDTGVFCKHINPDGTIYPSQGEENFFIKKSKHEN